MANFAIFDFVLEDKNLLLRPFQAYIHVVFPNNRINDNQIIIDIVQACVNKRCFFKNDV